MVSILKVSFFCGELVFTIHLLPQIIKSIMFGKSRNKYSQTLAFAILADGLITSVLVYCFSRETCCCSCDQAISKDGES